MSLVVHMPHADEPADESRRQAGFAIRRDARGASYADCFARGADVLRIPLINKGTAFTHEERQALGIEGLLPGRISTLAAQVSRAYEAFLSQPDPLTRHIFLRGLQDRQEVLYYALLSEHLEEMLPIVYTPTVGDGVKIAGRFNETSRGITLSPPTVERAEQIVANHPLEEVRLVVATDSSAILGLGDQGIGGGEIAVGKLAIYTAAGGIAPHHTMPATLDVGTDHTDLRGDPLYVGEDTPRLRGEPYFDFVDRFVDALWGRWPDAVIQWEDLSRDTAFAVLDRYKNQGPTFNDDIQGTGAVVLSGVLAACRMRGLDLKEQRVVIHGAGAGGLGVAWALRTGMERAGLSADDARRSVCVLDSRGLLVDRDQTLELKRGFGQDPAWITGWEREGDLPNLIETIRALRPTVLIGLSGTTGAFDQEVVSAMLEYCDTPIIMPLSNPTSLAEAAPADLIEWSEGRALVATGSPFDPVVYDGHEIEIGQGNNAFIFPGLGHGAVLSGALSINDAMVVAAAVALAEYTVGEPAFAGRMYPPVAALPDASRHVAAAVIRAAVDSGVACNDDAFDLAPEELIARNYWTPAYLPVVVA